MLHIALATVGAGKTEYALHKITSTLEKKPFARVWVLLPTERQQDAFRQRLIELNAERNLYFNVEFFNFYTLYRRLLNMAQQPARGLADSARFSLLRTVIRTLRDSGDLPIHSAISETPGFVRIVAEFINELKQNRIEAEVYLQAAKRLKGKDRELSLIYAEYQRILQKYDLVDQEGEGWLALARLKAQENLAHDVDLLIVDGFDQFTRVQASLLQVLSQRVRYAMVTLTTVMNREDTVGRRFQQALETLRSGDFPVKIERLMGTLGRHDDLQHVAEAIFLPGAIKRRNPNAVKLIEAPDIAGEVAALLRHVKRLLLNGTEPEDILIALRDWERYQPHFVALAKEYRIPLALHYGEKLSENPAINVIMKLLTLRENNFRRRELLDVLRSPYIRADGLDSLHVAILETVSQRYSVTGDPRLWQTALQLSAQTTENEDGEVREALLDEETAEALEWNLSEFFGYVQPPAEGTAEQYVAWLENLIGEDTMERGEEEDEYDPGYNFKLIAAVRDGDDETLARDLLALQAFKKILRGLLATQTLLHDLDTDYNPRMTWETFFAELKTGVDKAEVNAHPNRGGRVLVTTASNARGLPHRHVVVPGLSEGIFPKAVPEDRLYLDSERRRLSALGVELSTMAERANDDGLFYELISLPRDSLLLTRPTSQDGQPWTESHLWCGVSALFDGLEIKRIRAGDVVRPEEAASLHEVALAVADGLSRGEPEAAFFNWLLYHERDYWLHIAGSQSVESRRLSNHQPHDHYTGKLHDPLLVERAASTVGDSRLWSATQFNEYGACPFQFFAKRLLKLQELKPPEEGMDVLQSGSLNHEILEKTYRVIQEENLAISPENQAFALETLREIAAAAFATAPEKYGFRPTALWREEQQTLLRRLELMVSKDFSPLSPIAAALPGIERRPYKLEAPFGRDGGPSVTINLDDSTRLNVNGYIDRIDRVGDSLVVIDYKSGTTPFKIPDMEQGRSFQMIVYLLAAKEIVARDPSAPRHIAGGLFWHIRNGEKSGHLTTNTEDVTQAAMKHLSDYITFMRQGDFAEAPGKVDKGRCSSHCEYQYLCRLCALEMQKPRL
jgi:ATP-dependent helicase/nuclease subunit B